ncbi:ATP-binding protein [Actinomadura parmotrematis]|uniref:histidine kinase n=1 Tax=Actinomadura parmotrematis TaxID=2864039 RepID=A0ABS7G1Q0_9ACTN|nr:ATP-binding protein [Actinomadura parmotrematis]MBW8486628.1 sensor histidine kinase [Actinomadura parmotrematis]
MSAHAFEVDRSPLERALVVWLAAVTVLGAAWLWALFAADQDDKAMVAWGGGGASLLVALALAVAAYYAAAARSARERAAALAGEGARLERQIVDLLENTLPTAVRRVREGASPDGALTDLARPGNPALQRMLHTVTHEIAAAERAAATAKALTAALEDELRLIVEETLPAAIQRIRTKRVNADRILFEAPKPANALAAQLLHDAVHGVSMTERINASTLSACASAGARLQAMATSMLAELRELEFRYDEQPVFHDLLALDHRVSQMGRFADGVALLSGGRSGRRWTKPIRMESILRGALGRINDYTRVQLHNTCGAAVAGHAAEGVMHALAELMDNAANFSARNTDVHVYVEEEDAGVVVVLEDSGLGMRSRERDRAQRAVSQPISLDNLPSARIGLTVVGKLAAKHGLRVNYRPSARGGIGVVVMIPRTLITQPREDFLFSGTRSPLSTPPRANPLPQAVPATAPIAAPVPVPGAPADAVPAGGSDGGGGEDDGGFVLPQRKAGETLANSPYPVSGPNFEPVHEAPPPRGDGAARFAAFRQAGRDRDAK